MYKAQGALEYLIIIAVVISITAVITMISVNYFGGQQQEYYYVSCQQAAAACDVSLSINSNSPCTACETACNFTDGTEIFTGAIECCKCGLSSQIYEDTSACSGCGFEPACTGAQTRFCITADSCPGTETCVSGVFGECEKNDPNCPYPVCGNGVLETGEDCDDGNYITTDSCIHCTDAECGDGYLWSGVEDCDDGNYEFDDGCSRVCTLEIPCSGECGECEACIGGACTNLLFDLYSEDIFCYPDLGEECIPCKNTNPQECLIECPY